jgi:hypothetical protein
MDIKTTSCECAGPLFFASTPPLILKRYRTMTNVLLKKQYPKEYTTTVSTRVSNALLVGEVIGQVVVG